MTRLVWILLAIVALTAALTTLLAACEEPTPTPTPPPSPTPTPTPQPTPLDRLGWYDAPPDLAHWIAWAAIRRMALDDESLSEEIAGLPWVVDGINPEEAGVLDDVSWLLKTDTAVLETILKFRWMSEDGVISADTRRALRAIRAATDADPRLGSTLAAYGWIPDELTQHEAEALEILAEAVFPAFRTQTVTGIGAIRVPRSGLNAPPSVTAEPFEFARLLAEYPWVRDGIDPPEPDNLRQLSRTVSRATPANADLIRELTNVAWIQDGITDLEAQAVVSWDNFFSNIDESHLILAETVWGFDWVQDDTNIEEISLVDHLANLANSDGANQVRALETVLSYDWLRDDVTTTELAFMENLERLTEIAAEDHADALETVLSYDWLRDDVTPVELAFMENLERLTEVAAEDHADALETVLSYYWLRDDVTPVELAFMDNLERLTGIAAEDHADALETVLSYDWLTDGISAEEPVYLRRIEPLFEAAGPETTEALEIMLGYQWIANGIGAHEPLTVGKLAPMLADASKVDPGAVTTIANYPWLADADGSQETNDLVAVWRFLRAGGREISAHEKTLRHDILRYDWINDGLTNDENLTFIWLNRLLKGYSPDTAEFISTLLSRPWLDAAGGEIERNLLRVYISYVRMEHVPETGLLLDLASYAWLDDGLSESEVNFLHTLTFFVADSRSRSAGVIPGHFARLPWIIDGIAPHELTWMRKYSRLAGAQDPIARRVALELGSLPWFQDDIDHFDASVVQLLASQDLLEKPEIADLDLFTDGISENDIYYLMALSDALSRSEHQYRDLLQGHHIAKRTLAMPLAGNIELVVVRHTPFPENDPTLDLMEDIALQLERFMGVPFPVDNVLILILEASVDAGETPAIGRAYFNGGYITMAPPGHNPGYHLAAFHEMSHFYWGGQTDTPAWLTEGAAGFLPDIARDALGQESLETRYRNLIDGTQILCHSNKLHDVSDLYWRRVLNPSRSPHAICIYYLGELFLMEMYMLLGYDATSAAMRQIYVDARDSGWNEPVTDQRIYDAFAANTPEDKMEDFHELFERVHGGAKVKYPKPAS